MAEGNGTLGPNYQAIMSGDPATFDPAAEKFNAVRQQLDVSAANIPGEIASLAKSWQGPASTKFGALSTKVVEFMKETEQALRVPGYYAAIQEAKQALIDAQGRIQQLVTAWNQIPDTVTPDMASWNAASDEALNTLITAYQNAGKKLTEVKADPGDITTDGGGPDGPGKKDGEGPEDKKGPDDKGPDGDKKEDLPKDGAPKDGAEPPKDGGAPPGGLPGPPPGGVPGDKLTTDGGPPTSGLPGDKDLKFDGGPNGPGPLSIRPPGRSDFDGGPPPGGSGPPGIGNPKGDKILAPDDDGPPPLGPPTIGKDNPLTELQTATPPPDGGTKLTSASNSPFGPPGGPPGGAPNGPPGEGLPGNRIVAPPPGGVPSRLTSAGPISRPGDGPGRTPPGRTPPGAGGPARTLLGPGGPPSTLTSAGNRGSRPRPGGPGPMVDLDGPDPLGYYRAWGRNHDDDETEERETWLVGDEEWDDQSPDAAIGRPGASSATQE